MVNPNWLLNLYLHAKKTEETKKIGMFAPKINVLNFSKDEPEQTDEPYNQGHSYHIDGACLDIPRSKVDRDKIFCHCYAGSLLSRKMLEESGLTDDDYWIFYSCPNLGWKVHLHGWKAEYVPEALMWHRRSKARKRSDLRKLVERNRILTILRFMPISKRPLAIELYLNQERNDGTSYEEKLDAIKEAHHVYRGQYDAAPEIRLNVYKEYCQPRK